MASAKTDSLSYEEFNKLPDIVKYELACFAFRKLTKISNKTYPKKSDIALWSDTMAALEICDD